MPLPPVQKTVLFIDDERYRLTYYVEAVEDAGHVTFFCDTAADGLAFIQERYAEIDVIVLDMMMPTPANVSGIATNEGQDTGLWLLKEVRDILTDNTLPVIVLSNKASVALSGLIADQVLLPEGLVMVTSKNTETTAAMLPGHITRMCNKWKKV